jgi:cell division protein FtsQ
LYVVYAQVLELGVERHGPGLGYVARFNTDGTLDRLFSDHRALVNATGLEHVALQPHLVRQDARVQEVVALFTEAQRTFSGTQLAVRGVRLSARGSWSLTLADGARIVIGRAEPAPRLQRLVRYLPQLLQGEARAFDRIDLRYTNGFAVRWLPAAEPTSTTQNAAKADA